MRGGGIWGVRGVRGEGKYGGEGCTGEGVRFPGAVWRIIPKAYIAAFPVLSAWET